MLYLISMAYGLRQVAWTKSKQPPLSLQIAAFIWCRVKIWRLENEETGTWICEDEWKAHDAPVTKLSWAHPEFGSVIATASFDRTVKVWEQAPSFLLENRAGPRWIERSQFSEAKGSVRAVEFGPSSFGLRLVCSLWRPVSKIPSF